MIKRLNIVKFFIAIIVVAMFVSGVLLSVDFKDINLAQTHAEDAVVSELTLKEDDDFITDEVSGNFISFSDDAMERIEQVNTFDVVFPAKVKALVDYSWSTDSPFYNYRRKLVKVDFAPETEVATIGNYTFYYCSVLTSITFPDCMTSIGDRVFYGCSSLKSIKIPDGVTSIGSYAFYTCSNLENVEIGQASNLTTIGSVAFSECSMLTSIKIPDGVTSIDNSAFSYCLSLTSIHIPSSVTIINPGVFRGCSSLETITVDAENQNYSDGRGWGGKNVIIDMTSALKTLQFGCSTSIIPDGVKCIGDYAFYNYSGLTSINIPKSVIGIYSTAFNNCYGLRTITVDAENQNYSDGRDMGGENVIVDKSSSSKTVVVGCATSIIPDEVTSIGRNAFYGSSLTSITIPNRVTIIKDYAFYNCLNLTSINIPSSVTSIRVSAFCGCTGLRTITVDAENSIYSDCRETGGENVIVDKSSSLKTVFFGCATSVIPNDVASIGSDAFRECSSLTSITIPKCVTSIGTYAFYGCTELQKVEIEQDSSLTIIDDSAFENCSSLKSINIPNSVTRMNFSAFKNCSNLKGINIPDSLIGVASNTFSGCNNLILIAENKDMANLFQTNRSYNMTRYKDKITYPVEIQFQKTSETTIQKKLYKQDATWFLQENGVWERNPDYQLPDLEIGYWKDIANNYITLDDLNTKLINGEIENSYVLIFQERVDLRTEGITVQNYDYDGSKHELVIKIGEDVLELNRDYTITFISSNTTDAGTVEFTIVGIGDYRETYSGTFTISPKALDESMLNVVQEEYYHTGEEIKPQFTLKFGEKELQLGKDFTVSFTNNVEKGTAQMIITGQGNYSGQITYSYEILKTESSYLMWIILIVSLVVVCIATLTTIMLVHRKKIKR